MAVLSERSKDELKDCFHVDRKLVPFKLHFFFMFGGIAAMYPFLPIIAKQIGIEATAVGIAYSMIPVVIFLSNPIIGFLVDYFQNIKNFLIVSITISPIVYSLVLVLPKITYDNGDQTFIRVSLYNDSQTLVNISLPFERSCLREVLENKIECKLGFENEAVELYDNSSALKNSENFVNIQYYATDSEIGGNHTENRQWVTFYSKNVLSPEMHTKMNSLKIFQCSPSIHQCSIDTDDHSVFATYQYWTFFLLVVIGCVTFQSSANMSSVACCETLGSKIEDYGKQRLFGTISWGIICPLAGMMNDLQTGDSFLSGVYIMVSFIAVDIVILYFMNIPKDNASTSISKDLGKIFSSKEILVFSIGVAFIGVFNAMHAVFEFWYLEDMGASRTLLGLAVLNQCLTGEVPFLFFGGWLVEKLGHFLCLAFVFAAFSLRFLLYSLLKDPWLALPIDILHGVTFGLYHVAMAGFARVKAPKGLEATLLGIFAGLYEGLGFGLGSFVGGFGLDKIGARQTFFSTSMLSSVWFVAFLGAAYIFRSPPPKSKKSQVRPVEMEEMVANE